MAGTITTSSVQITRSAKGSTTGVQVQLRWLPRKMLTTQTVNLIPVAKTGLGGASEISLTHWSHQDHAIKIHVPESILSENLETND